MGNINTFDQGAKILQNVDVSSIVTGLALGIAEAQERLDNNSISQLIRLSETKVAGKSLLELGFQPAFYAFDYADVSASISLKMALKEEVEVDFSLAVDYKSNTTFNKDFFDQLKKNKSKSISQYSKTQKDVAVKVKTSETVSVNEKSFKIHEEEGSYSKIEKAKEQMRDETNELRVESIVEDQKILEDNTTNDVFIIKEGGYVIIAEPYAHSDTEGLLKLTSNYSPANSPSSPEITLKGGNAPDKFVKEVDFVTTLTNARTVNGGTVVGIDSTGIYRIAGKKVFEFFFEWDKYTMNYGYSNGVKTDGMNNEDMTVLALLLKRDPSLTITVKGFTDGSGNSSTQNNEYNKALGMKRAEAFKAELEKIAGVHFSSSKVLTITEGESLANGSSAKDPIIRKIKVELGDTLNDYIFFNGGKLSKNSANAPSPDSFIYLEETNVSQTILPITFKYGGVTYVLRDSNSNQLTSLINNKGKYQELFIEKVNDFYYLLHEETMVNYFIHSKENKELDVKVNNETLDEMNKENTKVYVGETKNDFSKLKESSKDFTGDRSLALSGSLDVRYARQFSMSVEGNASVSARMISVPPPTGLENYIQTLTGGSSNTNSN